MIKDKNECIDNCIKIEKYIYEYNNTCYEFINNNYINENNFLEILFNLSNININQNDQNEKSEKDNIISKLKNAFTEDKIDSLISNLIEINKKDII